MRLFSFFKIEINKNSYIFPITLGISQTAFVVWQSFSHVDREWWGLERVILDRYLFGQSEKPEDDKWPVFAHFPTEMLALL